MIKAASYELAARWSILAIAWQCEAKSIANGNLSYISPSWRGWRARLPSRTRSVVTNCHSEQRSGDPTYAGQEPLNIPEMQDAISRPSKTFPD